jgi:hypothetical protein
LHLLNSHFEILLMYRMGSPLFHELLGDLTESLALIAVGLDLLLELLSLCAFNVFAKNL